MAVTVEFITDQFEFAHGKTPRGYGGWAFSEERNPDVQSDAVIWVTGLYRDAKKQAAKVMRARIAAAGNVTDYDCSLWVLS